MRYSIGMSTATDSNRIFIQKVPNLVMWASNIYDWLDAWTWHRFCNTKLRLWLYKLEDKSEKFQIEADNADVRRFYAFMDWEYCEYDESD